MSAKCGLAGYRPGVGSGRMGPRVRIRFPPACCSRTARLSAGYSRAHPRLDAARLSNGAHLPAPGSHAYSVGIILSVRSKASGRLQRAR
jgi:hypothetical protein